MNYYPCVKRAKAPPTRNTKFRPHASNGSTSHTLNSKGYSSPFPTEEDGIKSQPQNGMPFIHVAGTNGKGSVCAFLTSVFREAGLKVGTFISPHLIDFEERIMVDGRQISREDVTRIGNVLLEQKFGVIPTMFDFCLQIAV